MMAVPARRRGEPLLALGLILACWIGARAAAWWSRPGIEAASPLASTAFAETEDSVFPAEDVRLVMAGPAERFWHSHRPPVRARADRGSAIPSEIAGAMVSRPGMMLLPPVPAGQAAAPLRAKTEDVPVSWPVLVEPQPVRRWSADAWVLVRGGGGIASVGPSIPTYGGSQAGAVLRYRLAPGNAHRPTAYLRASAALNGSGEREAALGLSARPLGGVPVVVAAEGRLSRLAGRAAVRPAIMAITEFAPVDLPGQVRTEFYLQGGYVGGLGATPFVDGQLRVDRRVAQLGPVELRAGAGLWGGAQRGAGRLDVGPSASLTVAKGPAAARVGLDWRFRTIGEAHPASGPALTISAGF